MRSQQPFILFKVAKAQRKALYPIAALALLCLVGVALLAACGESPIAPNQEGELVWRYDIASSTTGFLVGNSIFPPPLLQIQRCSSRQPMAMCMR